MQTEIVSTKFISIYFHLLLYLLKRMNKEKGQTSDREKKANQSLAIMRHLKGIVFFLSNKKFSWQIIMW